MGRPAPTQSPKAIPIESSGRVAPVCGPRRRVLLAMVAGAMLILVPDDASAEELRPDSIAHLVAGVGAGAFGHSAGLLAFENRYAAIAMGFGAGIAAGGGKEILDAAGLGVASGEDFGWTVLGTTIGVALTVTIDLAFSTGSSTGGYGWGKSDGPGGRHDLAAYELSPTLPFAGNFAP